MERMHKAWCVGRGRELPPTHFWAQHPLQPPRAPQENLGPIFWGFMEAQMSKSLATGDWVNHNPLSLPGGW